MISIFTNRLNHHQAPVADCLYELTSKEFRFVELSPPSEQTNKGAHIDYSTRPYFVQAWKNSYSIEEARRLALVSDVAIFGAESIDYEVLRSKFTNKLSFEMSERWLKRGLINAISPRFIKYQWYYHTLFYKKPVYKLCAGAYSANDQYLFHSYINKCYKWGYFINGAEKSFWGRRGDIANPFKILWCGRFLSLKHPELAIEFARVLRRKSIPFVLDMIGDGPALAESKRLVRTYNLDHVVIFHGAMENNKVIEQMCIHDFFLFTSDRREGWGAVLNEAMSSGCIVLTSDQVGGAPFLIEHRRTGCIFRNLDLLSLVEEFLWLTESDERMNLIREKSIQHYYQYWTPHHAAFSLLTLIDDLNAGRESSINIGPCSKAFPIKEG